MNISDIVRHFSTFHLDGFHICDEIDYQLHDQYKLIELERSECYDTEFGGRIVYKLVDSDDNTIIILVGDYSDGDLDGIRNILNQDDAPYDFEKIALFKTKVKMIIETEIQKKIFNSIDIIRIES